MGARAQAAVARSKQSTIRTVSHSRRARTVEWQTGQEKRLRSSGERCTSTTAANTSRPAASAKQATASPRYSCRGQVGAVARGGAAAPVLRDLDAEGLLQEDGGHGRVVADELQGKLVLGGRHTGNARGAGGGAAGVSRNSSADARIPGDMPLSLSGPEKGVPGGRLLCGVRVGDFRAGARPAHPSGRWPCRRRNASRA